MKKADSLMGVAKDPLRKKFLTSLKARVTLGEPELVPDHLLDSLFVHMVKEGINPRHLSSLAREGAKALRAYLERNERRKFPVGLKLLTLIRCYSLPEIVQTILKRSKSRALRDRMNELLKANEKFIQRFAVTGFKNQGFDETYSVLKKYGCDMGREKTYGRTLRDLFDYSETPLQLEKKGLDMLTRELPTFKRLTTKLAKRFRCKPKAEELAKAIRKKKSLKPKRVLGYLNEVRKHTVKVVNKHVVRVNPKYNTRVLETPTYLSGVIPSGAAFFLNYLTGKPLQLFLTTTDPRRSPHTVPAELLNLLIHEEYGHCVHGSNSSYAYGAKPAFIEMLTSLLGNSISEGMSFQRELEFLDVLKRLARRKHFDEDEARFVKYIRRFGNYDSFTEEYEFFTRMWRIVRFLRVIGDARINSGKQDLLDFLDWANEETGLSKSLVYHQVFPAHQGIAPGYASTYAIIGESIRKIQDAAKRKGKELRDLNTYACSMGFTPRSLFEERLKTYAGLGR